ncbi:AAA family ATPase [Gordonia sp. X0973]|uniref:MinD/ParA family ATP-binding protein n=1 Tax=Gordonia sp. X0973 TaxID=2742602 RepID=UPI000F52DC39|nr:MinD/ParA family protein [Gordonia sp. X0973]QKT06960.1 AAA family ATPase [Gordonia sp. X0973]
MADEYADDAFVDPPWLQSGGGTPTTAPPPPPPVPMLELDGAVLGENSHVGPLESAEADEDRAVVPAQQRPPEPAAPQPIVPGPPAPGPVPQGSPQPGPLQEAPPNAPVQQMPPQGFQPAPGLPPQGPMPQGGPMQQMPMAGMPMPQGPIPMPPQGPGYSEQMPPQAYYGQQVPMAAVPPQVAHAMQQQGPQSHLGLHEPQQRKLAQQGWRKAVNAASGGLIKLGESKSQQQVNALVQRVRAPISGQFNLAVLSLKGGVGKTTTTVGIGSAFASLRGDRVIAVDANPDLGTLASRIPRQTNSTVRTLLSAERTETYSDIRMHTSQAVSRLEVLASERDPVISESFSEDEYRKVIDILQRHYNIILTDCGTGLMHSAMGGVLDVADSLIIISSPAIDGAESATATLDWLSLHGYQHLVRQAVVVISASKPGGALVDLDMLTQHFLGKVRAVQIIPYDEHLAVGSHIDLDSLNSRTRTAFLELAATVADSFGQPAAQNTWGQMPAHAMQQGGYGMPQGGPEQQPMPQPGIDSQMTLPPMPPQQP